MDASPQTPLPTLKESYMNATDEQTYKPRRPMYYHRDGKPIVFDPELGVPKAVQWATYFEGHRQVRQTITPYHERLSTIFLGLDHNFMHDGPPIIFETMLFPPDPENVRRRTIFAAADDLFGRDNIDLFAVRERERFEARIKKYFPHDGLQLRYSTEEEAIETHNKLRLQCLIPPRWRRLLCYEIGGDATWE